MRIDFAKLDIQTKGTAKESQHHQHQCSKQSRVQTVYFCVPYPYDISKSVSADSFQKQVSYLRTKRCLPEGTIRFITQQLSKELSSSKSSLKKEEIQLTHKKHQQTKQGRDLMLKKAKIEMKQKEAIKKTKKKEILIVGDFCSIEPTNSKRVRKHKCQLHRARVSYLEEVQLQEETFKPSLNHTMKSYIHKKVVKERSNSLETMSNITIFDNLYRDAWRYDTKRSLKRLAVEVDIEKKKRFKVKPDKRWKLGTFKQRLARSLQKLGQQQQESLKRPQKDFKTGAKFFQPDLSDSRHTYDKLFKPVASMIIEKEFHSKCIEKAMTDKCSEKDMTTTINNRGSSFHRLGASSTIHLQSLGQAKKDLNTVETSVVDRYVKLFYPSQEVDQFQFNEGQLLVLTKQQKRVLAKLFQNVEEFQQSQKVSQPAFQAIFKLFYQQLTLYDKQILREKTKQERLKDTKAKKEVEQWKKQAQLFAKETRRSNSRQLTRRMDESYSQSLYYV